MKLSKLSSLFIAMMLSAPAAHAALTYNSVSGASDVDTTDTTKPIVYGGFAGTCSTGMDNSNTCDSCEATSASAKKFTACNKHNAYSSLVLTLVMNTDAAVTTTDVTAKIDSTSITTTGVSTTGAGGTLTVQIPWSNICSTVNASDNTCAQSISGKDIVISTSSTGTPATFTFHVVSHVVDATDDSTNTDCPDGVTPPSNTGFCHFKAGPGDGKIYANELIASDGYPTGADSIAFKNLMFFYEEQRAGETNADTVARIANGSNAFSVNVSTSVTPPSVDGRIDGLSNDTAYCMVMANQDVTGNIYYFTPTASVSADTLCATPEPVAGLLDDKHCFIATAAFGSDMAPEVQSFREFRNKFLVPNSWGRKFVKAYYHYSPKYAAMISESETAKTIVRGVLWPLLFFARMSVQFGFWTTLLILSLAILSMIEMYRRFFLGRARGEL